MRRFLARFLLPMALLVAAGPLGAAEAPPVDLKARIRIPQTFTPNAEILVQALDVDQLGLKLRGKVGLASLAPVRGTLTLTHFEGDPRKILALLSSWAEIPPETIKLIDIDRIKGKDLVLGFGGPTVTVKLAEMTLPQGTLKGLEAAYTAETQKWSVALGALISGKAPLKLPDLPPLSGLGLTWLNAQGTGGEKIAATITALTTEGSRLEGIDARAELPDGKTDEGAWAFKAKGSVIDMGRALAWVEALPPAKKALDKALKGFFLLSAKVKGKLRLTDTAFNGMLPATVRGTTHLAAPGAEFHLIPTKETGEGPMTVRLDRTELSLNLDETGGVAIDGLRLALSENKKTVVTMTGGSAAFTPPTATKTGAWRFKVDQATHDLGWTWRRERALKPIKEAIAQGLKEAGILKLDLDGTLEGAAIAFSGTLPKSGDATGKPTVTGSFQSTIPAGSVRLWPDSAQDPTPFDIGLENVTAKTVLQADGGVRADAIGVTLKDGKKRLLALTGGRITLEKASQEAAFESFRLMPRQLQILANAIPGSAVPMNKALVRAGLGGLKLSGAFTATGFNLVRKGEALTARAELLLERATIDFREMVDQVAGKKRQFRIPRFAASVDHAKGVTTIKGVDGSVESVEGGALSMTGDLAWPADMMTWKLAINADGFTYDDWKADGGAAWTGQGKGTVGLTVDNDASKLRVQTKGALGTWDAPTGKGFDIHLSELNIQTPQPDKPAKKKAKKTEWPAEKLFPDGPPQLPIPIRFQSDAVTVDHLPPIRHIALQAFQEPDGDDTKLPLRLDGGFSLCETTVGGGARVDAAGDVVLQGDFSVRDVNFSNIVACALKVTKEETPPVFIEGRTYGRVRADAQGESVKALVEGFTSDLTLTLEGARVMRLSKLHDSMGFLLGLLDFAGLNPTELKDTLQMDRLVLRGRADAKRVELKTIQLTSQAMRAGGRAQVDLEKEPPVIELDLMVDSELTPRMEFKERFPLGEDPNKRKQPKKRKSWF